jgi:possible 5'nucleotidase/UDP-sugar hydrolase
MRIKYYLLGGIFSVLMACHPNMNLVDVKTQENIVIGQEIEDKKEFVKLIAPYKEKLDDRMNQKISHTMIELNRMGDNSNLGALLSDYLLEGANDWAVKNKMPKVDAAILNIGGIRNNISEGDILVRNIFEVMPFENEMVIVKMKGEDIQGIFDYYEKHQKNNPVAQLNIIVKDGKLVEGLINGERPQIGKTYYIATSDYLAMGGDSMYFFEKGETIKTDVILRNLFLEYFRKNPEVKVKNDIRLKFEK